MKLSLHKHFKQLLKTSNTEEMYNILNLNVWYENKLDVGRQKPFGHSDSSSISTEEVALNSTWNLVRQTPYTAKYIS